MVPNITRFVSQRIPFKNTIVKYYRSRGFKKERNHPNLNLDSLLDYSLFLDYSDFYCSYSEWAKAGNGHL